MHADAGLKPRSTRSIYNHSVHKFYDNPAERVAPLGARVPASLSVGNVEIRPATVLAPMAGITDTVFRRFIRNLGGCGLMMTEFTSADGIVRHKDKKAKQYLTFYGNEHPISAQLFGSDPATLADAARVVQDLGFDVVDLNLGCPAKKVVKCNGGSGLLRDLPLIRNIFELVRSAVTIPFTVKFRAGWSDKEVVHINLAKMAQECGLAAVALHARTREQGYSGQANWEWIAAVTDALTIPVIGNGDVRSPEDAAAMVAQTGCDELIERTKGLRAELFGDSLRTVDVEVRDTGELDVLRRVGFEVAIDARVIAAESAAADNSDAQCVAARRHSAIVAHRSVRRQRDSERLFMREGLRRACVRAMLAIHSRARRLAELRKSDPLRRGFPCSTSHRIQLYATARRAARRG